MLHKIFIVVVSLILLMGQPQKLNADNVENFKLGKLIGDYNNFDTEKFALSCQLLLTECTYYEKMRIAAKSSIDGKGSQRVVEKISKFLKYPPL